MSKVGSRPAQSHKLDAAPAGKTYAERKEEALKAKNTAVLTYDELESIKTMCKLTNGEEDYMAKRQTDRK
jgi:hypothetical protein